MSNLILNDYINLNEDKSSKTFVKGHLVFKDDFGNIILEQDNLVLMNTRLFLFEHLFKVGPPEGYSYKKFDDTQNDYITATQTNYNLNYDSIRHNRKFCLFTVGSGGADVNSTPFNPVVPRYNDTSLVQPIPFVTYNNTKPYNQNLLNNPSVLENDIDYEVTPRGSYNNKDLYYKKYYSCSNNTVNEISGIIPYYGKMFDIENSDNNSDNLGWNTDYSSTGEISYTFAISIDTNECRGSVINELGLILGSFKVEYDESNNRYLASEINKDWELGTRLTFDTISLTNNAKLNIYYTLYI